jgi:carboxyl-terminal processing protease
MFAPASRRPPRSALSAFFAVSLSAAALALVGCSSPDETSPADTTPPDSCTTPQKNGHVLSLMKDVYLWYEEIPNVVHTEFDSPDALLDAIVFKEIDKWSYITTRAQNDAYYNEGVRVGLGVRMRQNEAGEVRLGLVYEGSPAHAAGLARGDKILALNGKTVAEIEEGDLWATILGEDIEGVEVEVTYEDLGGSTHSLTIEKAAFTYKSAPVHKVVQSGDRTVGYLFFDRFIGPSDEELTSVFQSFKEASVNDLVLDLRYNGGGLIDVALKLGGLIGGSITEGQVFNQTVHNDKHESWNETQLFEAYEESLDLPRVFILTTSSTASASELLINGLEPVISVTLIGGATYGKPVGSGSWGVCDLVVHPISFRMLNASGHGDFYEGLAADCIADDELSAALGDETEESFEEALHFIHNGSCSMSAQPKARGSRSMLSSKDLPLRGFQRELGF